MKLIELLDSAYRSEYINLDELDQIKRFAQTWKNFLTLDLEDLQISMINTTPPDWTPEERSDFITLLDSYPR